MVAAQNTLTAAQAALDVAEARDELFDLTATFTPDSPLITGGYNTPPPGGPGIAILTVTVSDLYTAAATGGPGDAKVQLFINTIGPQIRAETITITLSPAPPPAAP